MKPEELKQILVEGEGYRVEFKESLKNVDREMVAFANSNGGHILIGVRDDGRVVSKGIKLTNKLKSEIQAIARNCDPAIKLTLTALDKVVIIDVKEGDDKPYKCSKGFFVRNGATTQRMTRDEIYDFFTSEGKIKFDERICKKFDYKKHFDSKKFKTFLKLAEITKVINTPSLLVNLGVAVEKGDKLLFNNAGAILFAKDLSNIFQHTEVTCALFKGTDKMHVLNRKDYNEDLISNIDNAMVFLKQHIPVRYEMTGGPRRREVPEIPFDALREAVVNAVVHRDYLEKGARVMVEMFDDRIEIYNPGGLVKGLSPKQFGKKSVLRNPIIAGLLNRIEYIEQMGTGITKIKKLVKEAGLKPVKFEYDNFFSVTFKRPVEVTKKVGERVGEKVGEKVGERVGVKITDNQVKIIECIKKDPYTTAATLSHLVGISSRKIEENIAKLKEKGLVRRIGPAKGGHWEVIEK